MFRYLFLYKSNRKIQLNYWNRRNNYFFFLIRSMIIILFLITNNFMPLCEYIIWIIFLLNWWTNTQCTQNPISLVHRWLTLYIIAYWWWYTFLYFAYSFIYSNRWIYIQNIFHFVQNARIICSSKLYIRVYKMMAISILIRIFSTLRTQQ